MPVDYQEGKIYKIYNTINDDIYVGSTTLKLCERMRNHRSCIKNETKKTRPLYKAFIEHGVEHFYIELIEKCPCNDIDELRKKEGEYIRLLKPSLNKQIAGRTKNEYREDNREYLREYEKQNRENNKEYIKAYKATKIKCECGCDVTINHLARHKTSDKHKKLMNEIS